MYLILVLLLLHSVHSDPDPDRTVLIPEVERLAKILGPTLAPYPRFQADLTTESARLNISVDKYAQICFDAFVVVKFSPAEEFLLRKEIDEFLSRNISYTTDVWLPDLLPITHYVLKPRLDAMMKFKDAAKLKETRLFLQGFESRIEAAFASILKLEVREDVLNKATSTIAPLYRDLSSEARQDLERTVCIRNVILWSNVTDPQYTQLIDQFTEIVGLNVDKLIKENPYMSSVSIDGVNKAFDEAAKNIGMLPQDYVDTCANTFAAVKLSADEVEGLRGSEEQMFGKEYGKKRYNTTTELIEGLNIDNAPLVKLISLARKVLHAKLHHLTPSTQTIMLKAEKHFLDVFLQENNRLAANITGKVLLRFDEDLDSKDVQREIERVFCADTVSRAIGRQ